jgi:hypothetical protein
MTTNLSKLNNQINDFMMKLIEIFPAETSIGIFHEKFLFIKKYNPRKIYSSIYPVISPYKDHIMSKDDQFFLSLLNENRTEINEQDTLLSSINFHKLWKSDITDDIRNVIWQYFQVIYILLERIKQEST